MSSYVLVPGACHGGWWYEPVVEALAGHGHRAVAPTLGGLGPQGMDGAGQPTLDSHVAEVVAAVRAMGEPVVLAGHSYGGSVITGAADAVPELVRSLVYLDAFVPADGDSCWAMTDDRQRTWYVEGSGRTGVAVDPLPFFDERARPHPLATLVQRSRLTGAWTSVAARTYVEALGWDGPSPFATTAHRLMDDPDWTVQSWPTRHNVLADGPDRLVALLLSS